MHATPPNSARRRRPPARRALTLALALVTLALGLLTAPSAQAQRRGRGVEVWSRDTTAIALVPGQIHTLNLTVENVTARSDVFEEILDLPKGWLPLIPASQVTLKPQVPTTRLVSFSVPTSTPAGRYEIGYYLQGRTRPDLVDWETFTVYIQPVVDLRMEVTSAPSFVVSGEDATAILRVYNGGNTSATLDMSLGKGMEVEATLSPERLTLAPQGVGEVVVTLKTDPEAKRSQQHFIKILATPQAPPPPEGADPAAEAPAPVPARAVITLETVPRSGARPERFRTLPTTLTATAHLQNGVVTPQLSWQGGGALDPRQERTLDFFLLGPDASAAAPLLGRRDEYWARYSGERVRVKVGDQTYRLSWMTEAAAYGRGAQVEGDAGPVTAGAFYVAPRFNAQAPEKVGAFAEVDAGERLTLRVNGLYLKDDLADGALTSAGIVSAMATLTPLAEHRYSLELAGSAPTAGAEGDTGLGYRFEGEGAITPELIYTLQTLRSSPDFEGYFRDTDVKRATVQYSLGELHRLRVSYQSQTNNLDGDPDLGAAGFSRMGELMAQCLNQEGWCFDGGLRSTAFGDTLRFPGVTGQEHTLQARAVKAGDPWRLDARMNTGVRADLVTQAFAGVGGGQVIGTYNPQPGRILSLMGRIQYNGAEDNDLQDASRSVSLRGGWSLGERLSLTGEYQLGGSQNLSYQAQAGAELALPFNLTLAARGRYQSARGDGDAPTYGALVSLSRALDMPVTPRREAGSVRGQLVDPEGEAGIPGVVVKMGGATAITDAKGRFTFHALAPGEHALYVDNQSLGPERILLGGQGQIFTVRGARVTRMRLEAVRGAEVKGALRLGEGAGADVQAQGASLFLTGEGKGAAIKLGGIPVELRQGDVVLRRVTDVGGAFLFQGLTPGLWTLSVDPDALPAYHSAATLQEARRLGAGESAEVFIALSPRLRQVRILDDGAPARVERE